MNTIEQAAKRLEQLRRAGVDVQSHAPEAIAASVPFSEQPAGARPVASTNADSGGSTTQPDHMVSSDDRRSREVAVDLVRMRRAGLLVPGQPRSQLEEEFRIIKRPLLENLRNQTAMRPNRANLIMVTSAVPGEGKTQTALNLAVSIAMELDHTVLLVEADVLRPSALERLGVASSKGLLDLLDSPQADLSNVLLRTNIPKLTLLPAGTASSRSTELLASDAMNKLIEELASKYADRVVIFDTPPLLSTTESRVLASHMGQVVMVIEANKTPINTAKQAFAAVESHPVVLSMLNKHRGPKGSNAYGYYAP
jgi:protein-tyrosine kinase